MDTDSANKYLIVIGVALIVGVIAGMAFPNAKYYWFYGNQKVEVSKHEYIDVLTPAKPYKSEGKFDSEKFIDALEAEAGEEDRKERAKDYQKETSTNFSLSIMCFFGALGLGIVGINTSSNNLGGSENTKQVIPIKEASQAVDEVATKIDEVANKTEAQDIDKISDRNSDENIAGGIVANGRSFERFNRGMRTFIALGIILVGVINFFTGLFRINTDQNRGGGFVFFGLLVISFGIFFYSRFVTTDKEE
jgi:hypothetical protein